MVVLKFPLLLFSHIHYHSISLTIATIKSKMSGWHISVSQF
jgi:hypothetical protein